MTSKPSSWHIGVAAEALAASLFARCGFDVSVQYGADQPEYDLIAVSGEKMLKVSVKGSQDGSWGLTQSLLKDADYQRAIDRWLEKHKPRTVFCLVQYKNVKLSEMPRVYLATPQEIAQRLRETAKGRGDTILHEHHTWSDRAVGAGTTEKVPEDWRFTADRLANILERA